MIGVMQDQTHSYLERTLAVVSKITTPAIALACLRGAYSHTGRRIVARPPASAVYIEGTT